ncbi:serine hydrolase domain-containing protein [Variovorax sp. M-6]|uniref:serine hydrolase domain-containing protein n=1 Tax=Variovorax sp. M-6 TaxID=3233041 RepID=UPI003F964182
MHSGHTHTEPDETSLPRLSRRGYLALATAGLAAPLLQACGGGGGGASIFAQVPPESESVRWCREAILKTLNRSDSATTAVSVALLADDRVVWREAFGYADRENGVPATPDTRFNVASIAKVVAALAVMILRDRGKLALDQPLVELLPEFRMRSPSFTRITVRHLLSHASGMPGYNFRNALGFNPYPDYAQDTLQALADSHLKHEPGELAVYCNDGFTLVEPLVQRLSGLRFVDFVQREIFEPLGMRLSVYSNARSAEGSFVRPYEEGHSLQQELCASYATGGVITTPTDMMKLARMLLDQGMHEGRRIVSAEAIREMGMDQSTRTRINPAASSWHWGLGWDTVQQAGMAAAGLRGWSKNGGSQFFYTEFHVLPEARLAMLISGCGFDYGGLDLAEGLLLRAAAERGAIPKLPPAIVPAVTSLVTPAPDGAELAGIYANCDAPYQVLAASDGTLTLNRWNGTAWDAVQEKLRARGDGCWSIDGQAAIGYRFQVVEGRRYLIQHGLSANRSYGGEATLGEWLPPLHAPLPPAWRARVDGRWVCADEFAGSVWARFGPLTAHVGELEALPGYVLLTIAQPPGHAFLNLAQLLRVVDDNEAGMAIKVPGNAGRDLFELRVKNTKGQDELHAGGWVFRQTGS